MGGTVRDRGLGGLWGGNRGWGIWGGIRGWGVGEGWGTGGYEEGSGTWGAVEMEGLGPGGTLKCVEGLQERVGSSGTGVVWGWGGPWAACVWGLGTGNGAD